MKIKPSAVYVALGGSIALGKQPNNASKDGINNGRPELRGSVQPFPHLGMSNLMPQMLRGEVTDDGNWHAAKGPNIANPVAVNDLGAERKNFDGVYLLENYNSKRRLYAQKGKNWEDGVGAAATDDLYEDMKWKIMATSSEYPFYKSYYIENEYSGRRLYAQKNEGWQNGFGATSSDEKAADQEWFLYASDWVFPKPDKDSDCVYGSYYIVNAASHRRLYADDKNDWNDGVGASSEEMWEDQIWCPIRVRVD